MNIFIYILYYIPSVLSTAISLPAPTAEQKKEQARISFPFACLLRRASYARMLANKSAFRYNPF